MRPGTAVSIVIPSKDNPGTFVHIPGIVVSDPIQSSYVRRTTGATVQSMSVEVVSLREFRGRTWWQQSIEPVGLLARRVTEPVVGLDVDADGTPMPIQTLWQKVTESIEDLRRRQVTRAIDPKSRPKAAATA
jgi:hypothetical protein